MTIVALIPARIGSSRLARKVLADINGKPMIWHVWNRVCQAQTFDGVYIATDSDEVRQVAEGWGGKVFMTSPKCQSGTERIASLSDKLDADLIVNIQGDEPLIDPLMLDHLVLTWKTAPCDLITPVVRITELNELQSPTVVKVARTSTGEVLYFSRSPIPFVRDLPPDQWLSSYTFWGHIGVYGYRASVLSTYLSLPVSPMESAEQLEQLRFLNAGYRFQTVETTYRPIAVDVQSDLERVRSIIAKSYINL